jgi:DNA-binding CsgD family transcriptional regulator
MNTTRLIFLPDDSGIVLMEIAKPAEAVVAEIRTGQWTPPEPYAGWLAANQPAVRRPRLKVLHFGRVVIVLMNLGVPAEAPVCEEVAALRLSPRQRMVLEYLAEGLNNKQIAERLGLKPRTVALHVAEIKTRLGATSRTQVVSRAAALGLVGRGRRGEK